MNVKKTKKSSKKIVLKITMSMTVPQLTIAHILVLVYYYQSAIRITVFRLASGVFLHSLIGEMESKECEREEN